MIEFQSFCAPVSEAHRRQAEKAWQTVNTSDYLFMDLPLNKKHLKSSQNLVAELRRKGQQLVVVGMGGSSAGARAAVDFFGDQVPMGTIQFWDNTDEDSLNWRFSRLAENAQFLFVSKSGQTIEVLALFSWLEKKLKEHGKFDPARLHVLTEDRPSQLLALAQTYGLRVDFWPMGLSGRFSVLSEVGLVPMLFAGIPVEQVLVGAQWSLRQVSLVRELVALSLASFERNEWLTVFWGYSDFVGGFGDWLVQLWSESLGKRWTRHNSPAPRVSTPLFCRGSSDQHSLLQQFVEGAKDKWIIALDFGPIRAGGDSAFKGASNGQSVVPTAPLSLMSALKRVSLTELLQAQSESVLGALEQIGVSTAQMRMSARTPEALGALLQLMLMWTVTLGEALEINPGDQPGVELGKKILTQRLAGC